ncbi:CAP domain-containing protein [Nocardioides sp. J54]|uniref:CAP domain-containing protein n=1 Tax=Nocardioides sp. J54 TaxID=935866 RepID=UPI000A069870|nr:CAP domain-containing protein [Nocardioides sp. J54]
MARITRLVPGRVPGLVLGMALGLALTIVPAGLPAAAPAAQAAAAGPSVGALRAAPGLQGVVPTRLLVQRLLEDRVLRLTNVERRKRGCAPLRSNRHLRKSARSHTVRMAMRNQMSHQLPGEPYFSRRITNAGYRGWRLVAENVAHGFSGPPAVVRAWMQSPGHRRNILNCRLRDLGVGVVLSGGQLWWTQNFGRR